MSLDQEDNQRMADLQQLDFVNRASMRGVKDYYDAYSRSLNADLDRQSWDITPQIQRPIGRVDNDRNEITSYDDQSEKKDQPSSSTNQAMVPEAPGGSASPQKSFEAKNAGTGETGQNKQL